MAWGDDDTWGDDNGDGGGYGDPGAGEGDYDPWSDPDNYDDNGQYVGPGAWDDDGNYVGGGNDPYAGGSNWLKDFLGNLHGSGGNDGSSGKTAAAALGAAGKAAGALNQNVQNNRDRAARAAIAESNLDPFRGYMAQARDTGKLDMMANMDFTPPRIQLNTKYGQGIDLTPRAAFTPSATTRGVASMAMRSVAAGNRVPTMTDPSNYGKLPLVNYQAPPAAAAPGPTASAQPVGGGLGSLPGYAPYGPSAGDPNAAGDPGAAGAPGLSSALWRRLLARRLQSSGGADSSGQRGDNSLTEI